MDNIAFLRSKNIYLRPLVESDCEGPYLAWFNDAEVCRWNSHHVYPYTVAEGRAYIQEVNKDRSKLVLGIVTVKDDNHIGNIALDKIDYISRCAALTIVIGEKSFWRKGYGKEAARLLCDHGFLVLNLHRITCGTFEDNIGMRKLAEYLGMVEEGKRRQASYKLGCYVDVIEYGMLRSEYFAQFNLQAMES